MLTSVTLSGNYLATAGRRFIPIGVNWVPARAAMQWPYEWAHGPDYGQYGFPGDRLYQYVPQNILDYQTNRRGQQVLMQSWLSSFILCRQAGIHVGFPRECDDWPDVPLILAPVPASDMDGYHLYTTFWEQVRPLVQAGATLYVSLSAASAIPLSAAIDLFGAHIADRALWRPLVRLTFVQDYFGIQAGETFEFSAGPGLQGTGAMLDVRGAQVLAHDQDDKPALTVHECGQGHAVLCAYPIEFMLGVTPNAFEEGASCWHLYRALKRLAGIRSPFSVDRPEVEVGCLGGVGRDYVILVNHAPDTVQGEVVAACGDGNVMHILPEGAEPVDRAGDTWSFELPGFTGTLFEWRRA
jgi:hypothetical protein